MQIIADKHQNTEVLETCAKTLEVLCNEGNAIICTKCDLHRSTLIDNIVKKYKEAMDDWNAVIDSVRNTPYHNYYSGLKNYALDRSFQGMNLRAN